MKVETMVVADYAADNAGKVSIVGAGITRLTPPALPTGLPSLAVFLRVLIDAADATRDHAITIELRDPDGQTMGTPTKYTVPGADLADILGRVVDGEIAAIQLIALQIGPVFPAAGTYQIAVRIDGDDRVAYPLVVIDPAGVAGAAPGGPAAT